MGRENVDDDKGKFPNDSEENGPHQNAVAPNQNRDGRVPREEGSEGSSKQD